MTEVVRARSVGLVMGLVVVASGVGIGALMVRGQGDSTRPKLDFGVSIAVAPDGTVHVVDRADGTVLAIGDQHLREVLTASSLGPLAKIAIDTDGRILLVAGGTHVVRVARDGTRESIVDDLADPTSEVGNGDGGTAKHALLDDPHALTVTAAGYFFCDAGGRHLRYVGRQGAVNPVVSLPLSAGCVDLAAVPGSPDVVLLDEKGGVRRVTPDGKVQELLAA